MARFDTQVIEGPGNGYRQDFAASGEKPGDCDVVIAGGGIAGLATAIAIMEMSPFTKVSVLEAAYIGYGASGRSGGLLSPLPVPGWLMSAPHNGDHGWGIGHLRSLVEDAAGWIKGMIPEAEIQEDTMTLAQAGREAISIGCHTVDPLGLAQGLARHARALGVKIYEGTKVNRIEDCANGAYLLLADGHSVCAETVVVATNSYTETIMIPQARGAFSRFATGLPGIVRLLQPSGSKPGSIVMNAGYGVDGVALALAMAARVAAMALQRPCVEPDDERLHAIMQETRAPLGDMARRAGLFCWAWASGAFKPGLTAHSPGSMTARPSMAAIG